MLKEDFTIEQLEDGNFVVLAPGIYQNIDFINGGFITTEQRAGEILNLLLEQANVPAEPQITDQEKIAKLETQNKQLEAAVTAQASTISDQADRMTQMEADAVDFQNYVIEVTGGV